MIKSSQGTIAVPIRYLYKVLSVLALIVLLTGCNDTPKHNNKVIKMNHKIPPISEDTRQALYKIKEHSFLFGHHSVGENILDGLRTIAKETGVNLKITKLDNLSLTDKINFVDFSPGKNTNPKSKIDDFVKQIKKLNNEFTPDVAFLKFCYIDFPPDANVEDLLAYYKEKMAILKKEKPEITFVHFTVPLTKRPNDFKSRIKRLLGLQVWGDASNVSRVRFNNLLYKTFPEDPIFDIAGIESTRLDGNRAEFTHEGKTYYSLAPEYTNDGGHLNTLGQNVTASELVVFLANTLKTKKP